VGELVRRCPYCRAAVATVRCGRCFQMNVPEALHCSGCGHELGLEPIAEGAALSCPGCRQSLAAFRAEGGTLFDCARCGGQFVEHVLLRALLERREVLGEAVPTGISGRDATSTKAAGAIEPVRYVPCPACSAVMNRKNFGGTSGVVVDVCKKDGMWFDAGELPRVLAFVSSGGLARARQRDEERRAEEKRAEIARAIASANMGAAGGSGTESDAALGLLDFLRRL
jgi:Zn-finger nucleic acid-binding protein